MQTSSALKLLLCKSETFLFDSCFANRVMNVLNLQKMQLLLETSYCIILLMVHIPTTPLPHWQKVRSTCWAMRFAILKNSVGLQQQFLWKCTANSTLQKSKLQNFCGKIAVVFSVMICRPKMGKSACVHVDGADGKAWVPLSQYKKESLNLISDGISGILIDGEARIVDPDLFTTDLISVQGIDFLLIPNGVEVNCWKFCWDASKQLCSFWGYTSVQETDFIKSVSLNTYSSCLSTFN